MLGDSKPAQDKFHIERNRCQSAKRVTSTSLFGGMNLVLIEHQGDTYTLRETRNGKLILTK